MPYMTNGKRDYKKEYEKYQGTPEQLKHRAERNHARKVLADAGLVHKGDNKDVGHIKALGRGGSNSRGNTEVQTKSGNRSFARNSNGSMKSETSKRERSKK